MDNNSENNQFENTSNIEPTARPDWLLRDFVEMANDNPAKEIMDITLLTHGVLVTGLLVSGREYFRGIGEALAKATGNPDSKTAQDIKEHYIQLGNKTYDNIDKAENPYPVNFIHLKNARFFHPNGTALPGSEGVWWRGRLFEVSGFFLGSLQAQE